jgi:mannan endo-1,4-beta-mannosidase
MKTINKQTLKPLLLSCFIALGFAAKAQIFEAENASLSGDAQITQSAARSGGAFVELKGGTLEKTIELEEEGFYNIYINAAAPHGDKINGFIINGSSVDFALDQSAYISKEVVNSLKLDAGENQIAISNSWGWINIDYFEFVKQEESERFNLNTTLVTPNPTPQAQKLYDFLLDNYGKKIISGVMTLNSMDEVNWLKANTGKEPALLGLDFMHCDRNYSWYNDEEPMDDARKYYNRNGIPAFCWHWRDPSRITEEFYTRGTDFNISKINDPESDEYKAMIADIDYISQFLLQLQDDSVSIIWRPLHEAAGGWFWWGAKGPEPCKLLWQIMFDRMVHHHGIRNLIWMWTREPDDEEWYPGDEYVDMVGRDIYKKGDHSSQILEFNQMNTLYGKSKMLAISECGSFPDPDKLIEDGAAWSFFMPWWGEYTRDEEHNPLSLWQKILDHEYVLTLDEMPDLRAYVKQNDDGTNSSSHIDNKVNVFPSYFSTELNIKSDKQIRQVSIYDLSGNIIQTIFTENNTLTIPTNDFKPGVYLIKTNSNKTFKVIK